MQTPAIYEPGAELLRGLSSMVDDREIAEIAGVMVCAMLGGIAVGDLDADFRSEALDAARATARGFLDDLARDPSDTAVAPRSLEELARTMARRGHEVTDLVGLTRHAQAVYWPAVMQWMERSVEDPVLRLSALADAYEQFSVYLETLLDQAVGIYQQERDHLVRGAQLRRDETIRALLSRQDIAVESANRHLRYDLLRCHTAIAVWWSETGGAAESDSIVDEVSKLLGGSLTLRTTSSSRGLWAWIATHEPPSATACHRVRSVPLPDGARLALGQPQRGIRGFVRSHEEARAAQRLACEAILGRPVLWYSEIELISLLGHDRSGLEALVERELGELVHDDAATDKLRETTLAYLRNHCSATAAAREIKAHKNTVRYRIERVEERLGRPLIGQELPLQLALTAVVVLGPSVLPNVTGRPETGIGPSGTKPSRRASRTAQDAFTASA